MYLYSYCISVMFLFLILQPFQFIWSFHADVHCVLSNGSLWAALKWGISDIIISLDCNSPLNCSHNILFYLSSVIDRCLWQISLDQSWRLSTQIQPTQVSWLHMMMKYPCPSEIINMIISCQRMRLVQEDQTEKRWILAWEKFWDGI